MRRWGIFGGSFDPPHLGHLWIALLAREQLDLEQVLLIPAAAPPHKSGGNVAPYAMRLEMLRRLAAPRPGLVASDREADASRPSYTVETLRSLREELGHEVDLWLLLGEDSLRDLAGWKDPAEIARLAGIAVYGRAGALPARGESIPSGARVRWIDGPLCGLSSTWIRARLRLGLSVAEMVPAEILPLLGPGSPYAATDRAERGKEGATPNG